MWEPGSGMKPVLIHNFEEDFTLFKYKHNYEL